MAATEKSPLLFSKMSDSNNDDADHKKNDGLLTEVLQYFIQFMGWVPLILSLAIGELQIAFTAAFAVAAFNIFVLSFVWYKMGKTVSWIKTLDIIFITLFGILTILAWTLPNDRDNIKYLSGVIINGGIAVGVAVTWAFGKPFIKNYVEDNVGVEGATHPNVMHMVKRLTTMWLLAFTLMTLVSLVPAVMQLQGNPNSTAFMVCNIITWIILAVCLTVAFWLYPEYFEKHQDEFTNMYKKEIEEWDREHPDHEFAKEDYVYENA